MAHIIDERIIARRVTPDEFCKYMEKLEYYNGRIITGPGVELFVGVEQFEEATKEAERAWQEEEEERKKRER